MDDLRLGAVTRADWYAGQTKDDRKKRSKHQHVEPPEEPIDSVLLSSTDSNDDTGQTSTEE